MKRTHPKDIKIRGLFVYLDGKEVANLSYGQEREFEVSPGLHLLRVTNQLYSKEAKFEVDEEEIVVFEGGNFMSRFWMVVLGWSGFLPYKVFLNRVN